MSFTFNGVSFREEFPGCEAIQSEYPNLSNLSVDSLEIPRMERRRFLETTRPNTSIEFYVILRGDTPEELEETRDRFMLTYDPTLGPRRLVLDEEPDWYWEMTLADEIVWERLTWECGRAGNSGGYRLAADVKFESFNDAAQRLVEEAWGPTEPPPPPEWVEVGRNLATNPNWERLTMDAWQGHEDSIYSSAVVNADWTGSGKAGRSTWDVKVDERGNSGYSIIRESQLEVGKTYTFVQRIKFGQAGRISTRLTEWASVFPESFDVEDGEIVTKYITFVYSAEIRVTARMYLSPSSTGENVWIEYGDPLIYEGEYQPDREWFSGDHAPEGMRSEWLGEPNNSVSVLYEQEEVPDGPDLPDVTSIRCEGNTRTWPTVQFTATATAAQTVRVTVGGFTVDVAGPFTAQDTAVLDYDLMRFELFREGVKVASLVPRMSTLDRLEIRPQDGWIPVSVEPVDGGTVSDVKVKPNSRKQ